jgi:hypothetical protein
MTDSSKVAPTRDEARSVFAAKGLTYAVLTRESLTRLCELIDDLMSPSGLIKGSYRMNNKVVLKKTKHGPFAQLTCKSFYFDDREAVSFNTDGFIGFAGWADDNNIQPVLKGFMAWVDEVATGFNTADSAANRGERG